MRRHIARPSSFLHPPRTTVIGSNLLEQFSPQNPTILDDRNTRPHHVRYSELARAEDDQPARTRPRSISTATSTRQARAKPSLNPVDIGPRAFWDDNLPEELMILAPRSPPDPDLLYSALRPPGVQDDGKVPAMRREWAEITEAEPNESAHKPHPEPDWPRLTSGRKILASGTGR